MSGRALLAVHVEQIPFPDWPAWRWDDSGRPGRRSLLDYGVWSSSATIADIILVRSTPTPYNPIPSRPRIRQSQASQKTPRQSCLQFAGGKRQRQPGPTSSHRLTLLNVIEGQARQLVSHARLSRRAWLFSIFSLFARFIDLLSSAEAAHTPHP